MLLHPSKKDKKLQENTLTLGYQARIHAEKDPEVINATVGMLNDENNQFYVFRSILKAQENVASVNKFAYPSVKGSVAYKDALISWLFRNTYQTWLNSGFKVDVCATPGGTGAITTVINNCLIEGQKILYPYYMWDNYRYFASEKNVGFETYDLYDGNGNFNFKSLKDKIDELLLIQDRIVLLLNDPCENPTGYSLSDDEYDKLIDLINSYDVPFTLLMDCAYFDYYDTNPLIIRERYAKLTKLNQANVIFALSGSKSFGLYGLRIGACLIASKNDEDLEDFANSFEYTARAIWSCSSHFGESLMIACLSDSSLMEDYYQEIKEVSLMLKKRADNFLSEAKKYDLPLLPYSAGFFIVMKHEKPNTLADLLIEEKVYVVPMKSKAIRIALCSMNQKQCHKLPSIIHKCLKKLNN